MVKVIVTLMQRGGNATVTVVATNRNGRAMAAIHREILKEHPGYFILKSKRVS